MFRSTGINEIKGSLSINWKPTEYWLWAGLNEAAGGENISPSQAVFVFVYQRSHRGGISHSSQTLRTRRPSGICATTWAFYTSTAVVLASGRVFLNTQAKHICFFFTRTYKIMWFTCFNTCWSSVRVCYDVFAQHLKDFSLIFHILEIETSTWWERSHTSKIWITWHIRANPQFIRHIIHFIYPLFIFVHLNNQSSEDTLRENCTFSMILVFLFKLQELLAQNTKWAHVGECGWCFYVRFYDRRCAGQWIYKGTSAFKNIKKETFPTQTDQ